MERWRKLYVVCVEPAGGTFLNREYYAGQLIKEPQELYATYTVRRPVTVCSTELAKHYKFKFLAYAACIRLMHRVHDRIFYVQRVTL